MGGFCLVAQPLVIAFPARFWILHDGVSILNADGIVQPPHGPGAAPEVSELPVTVQVDGIPDDVVMDMGLVDVGAYDKGVVLVNLRASSWPSRFASSGVISPGTKDCRRW